MMFFRFRLVLILLSALHQNVISILSEQAFLQLSRSIRHNLDYRTVLTVFCGIQRLQKRMPGSALSKTDLRRNGVLEEHMRGRFEGRLLATLSALKLIHVNEYGNVRMAPTTFRCHGDFIENHDEDMVATDQISASYASIAVARAIIQDTNLQWQRLKEVHLILLLSLGRSASTLVGEMLNRREGSLYIYEPCRALEKSQTLQDKGVAGCLALCARLLTCTFTSLDATIIFNDQQAVKQSQLLRPLIDVRKEKRFEVFQRVCEAASLRIVKEVRIVGDPIQEASPAEDQYVKMLRNPSNGTSFKILHIVRDPRGFWKPRCWGLTKMEATALLLTPPTPEGRGPPSLRPKHNPITAKLLR